jgi:DNA repair exonuclease SbcCD ATPase subunit
VKDYEFHRFERLSGSAPEEKRVIKAGFKKKFSERVSVAAPPAETEKVTRIAANAPQEDKKVVVSGGSALGKAPETFSSVSAEVGNKEKSASLLESKIQSLETTLKQREELITKLNKEIEEIKDPMKMGVISGIKDNQVEGLKDNIARLKSEAEEAAAREKELMTVVDKAIQLKDEAVKKLKDYETKLRQSQGGNNSKMQMLEKQLDEQKRQNKELSKKITQLMEQLGGKAA